MNMQSMASAVLALGGLILMGIGIYFGFVRPPLLPEDVRYMSVSLAEVHTTLPGLELWLLRVFRVLGGFMFATGLLTVYVAATSFRTGRRGVVPVIFVSGLTSIGWMAITNFVIDSDFKWLLLIFTLPWVVALTLTLLQAWRKTI